MKQVVVEDSDLESYPQLTKDEWIQILSDEDFMSLNYKFVLNIFFLEPEYKADFEYLSEQYNVSKQSISGYISQFNIKVKKKSSRLQDLERDSSSLWSITMTNNKNSRNGEWQLRQELVDAMIELDFISANQLQIDSLGALIEHINKDTSGFKQDFAKARKKLTNMRNMPNSKILFKYDDLSRDWSINVGGGTEIQYHINLRNNNIGYGLGFNAQYVPFNNKKTSLEHVKPFVDAFLSMQNSEEVKKLTTRDFSVDLASLKIMGDGGYNLFGRIIEMNDNKLPLIDYYKILNDLKGDLFNLYKKIFETANELDLSEKEDNEGLDMRTENPLVTEIMELLETNKNVILTGAPGTGKTYIAKKVVEVLDAEFELVQFHPSYDYTDFVEGLRPTQNENGEVGFELKDGVFKSFCKKALKHQDNQKLDNFDDAYQKFTDDVIEMGLELKTRVQNNPFRITINKKSDCVAVPETVKQTPMIVTKSYVQTYFETGKVIDWKPYLVPICEYIKTNYDFKLPSITDKNKKFVIILDEINRAEVSKVLGELFFSIDPGYRGTKGKVKTQYANLQTDEDVFKDGFYIPENVYIIGTMNDIDRSVESFDFAMRRRFAWKEIKAEDRLSMWVGNIDSWIDEATLRLQSLNKAIESIQGLNSAYHVGPAYFLKLANYDGDFEALWRHHLQSLLFEYLRGYPDADDQLASLKNAYNLVDSDDSND